MCGHCGKHSEDIDRLGPQQGRPVVFEELGGSLVAGGGGRRRLSELCVIECY
jgi:hypothetical protein